MKKLLFVVALSWLSFFNTEAQTNVTQIPNLMPTNNWVDRTALYLGAPSNSTLDVAGGLSYIPSFHSGQKWGYWVAATFATAPSSVFAYEFGSQYIKISPKEGMDFQPNGLLLLRRTWDVSSITITPLAEVGGAVDSRFTHPYGIVGAGLDVGWHGFSVLGGVERWTGPYDSFTDVKAGVAYSYSFK